MKQTHFKEEVIHYSFLILLFVLYDLFLCSLVLISSLSVYHFESLPCACKQSSCNTKASLQDVCFFAASVG
jgi:hypothetical protein